MREVQIWQYERLSMSGPLWCGLVADNEMFTRLHDWLVMTDNTQANDKHSRTPGELTTVKMTKMLWS